MQSYGSTAPEQVEKQIDALEGATRLRVSCSRRNDRRPDHATSRYRRLDRGSPLMAIVATVRSVTAWPLRRSPQLPARPSRRTARPERRRAEPDSPAVEAVLETKPSTPAELVRAAKILADLGRPDLAKAVPEAGARRGQARPAATGRRWSERVRLADVHGDGRARGLGPGGPGSWPTPSWRRSTSTFRTRRGWPTDRAAPGPLGRGPLPGRWPGCSERASAAVGPLVAVLADPSRAAEHANVRGGAGPAGLATPSVR